VNKKLVIWTVVIIILVGAGWFIYTRLAVSGKDDQPTIESQAYTTSIAGLSPATI